MEHVKAITKAAPKVDFIVKDTNSIFSSGCRHSAVKWYTATGKVLKDGIDVATSGAAKYLNDDTVPTVKLTPEQKFIIRSNLHKSLANWLTHATNYERQLFDNAINSLAEFLNAATVVSKATVVTSAAASRAHTPLGPPPTTNAIDISLPTVSHVHEASRTPTPLGVRASQSQPQLAGVPATFNAKGTLSKPSRHLWDGKVPYAKLEGKLEDRTTFHDFFTLTPEHEHPHPHIMSRKTPSNRMNRASAPYAKVGGFYETQSCMKRCFPPDVERSPTHEIKSKHQPNRALYDGRPPYAKLQPLPEQVLDVSGTLEEASRDSPTFSNTGSRRTGPVNGGDWPYARLKGFVNLSTSNTSSKFYSDALPSD